MFNIDNSLRYDTREDKPMAPRRLKVGQGFSLFDLKDVISDVTDTLGDALSKQGVEVSKDNLFLQLQNLVQAVGSPVSPYADSYSGVMSASDKIPYSIAGDMLVIAYEQFKNGEEKSAVKNILAAMGSEDFEGIANGIFLMNKKSDLLLNADESNENDNTSEDTDPEDDLIDDDDTDDTDDTDDDDDDDLEDSDIDDAVADNETTASDEDEDEDNSSEEESNNTSEVENKDSKPEVDKKPTPMGKTSSELTASHTSKVLANKLSLDGSVLNRAKAKEFLNKNRNL